MFWEHVFKLSEHTPCKSEAHNQASLEPPPQENLYEGNPITSPTNFAGALVHVFTYSLVHEFSMMIHFECPSPTRFPIHLHLPFIVK
jgi:hypothetical protein